MNEDYEDIFTETAANLTNPGVSWQYKLVVVMIGAAYCLSPIDLIPFPSPFFVVDDVAAAMICLAILNGMSGMSGGKNG